MQPEPVPYQPDSPTSSGSGAIRAEYRSAIGQFATGVTIVTTRLDGIDHAMTVNSFTSVSLDPLMVLFCAEKIARFHEAVLDAGVWAVSVLSEGAQDASNRFATRGRPLVGQLDGWPHHRGEYTGSVVFSAALAAVECRTHAVFDGGDHSIVLGDVLGVSQPHPEGSPLLYYEGRYGSVTR